MISFDFYRSTSQRRLYRTCGKKFLLRYGHKWRSKVYRITYFFGTVIQLCLHVAIENRAGVAHEWGPLIKFLKDLVAFCPTVPLVVENGAARLTVMPPDDPQAFFLWLWGFVGQARAGSILEGKYTHKELRDRGVKLIVATFDEVCDVLVLPKGRPIVGDHGFLLEVGIDYAIGTVQEKVIPDYVGPASLNCIEARFGVAPVKPDQIVNVVIDWKTADREKDETAAELDEQLTSEQLGAESRGIQVDYVCLATFVYQVKQPRVQWLWKPARTKEQLAEFQQSAVTIDRLIRENVFYENDQACGQWGGCEYQPLCYASQKHRIAAELQQDPKYAPASVDGLFDDV
jgi:hypothetical protein